VKPKPKWLFKVVRFPFEITYSQWHFALYRTSSPCLHFSWQFTNERAETLSQPLFCTDD